MTVPAPDRAESNAISKVRPGNLGSSVRSFDDGNKPHRPTAWGGDRRPPTRQGLIPRLPSFRHGAALSSPELPDTKKPEHDPLPAVNENDKQALLRRNPTYHGASMASSSSFTGRSNPATWLSCDASDDTRGPVLSQYGSAARYAASATSPADNDTDDDTAPLGPAFLGSAAQIREATVQLMRQSTITDTRNPSDSLSRPKGAQVDFYMPMELNDMLEQALEQGNSLPSGSVSDLSALDDAPVPAKVASRKAPRIHSRKVLEQEQRRTSALNTAIASRATMAVESDGARGGSVAALYAVSRSAATLHSGDVRDEVSNVLTSMDHAVAGMPELDQRFLYQKLNKATLSEPSLVYVIHGQDWSNDLFAVYQNSVRREMMDLYYILGSLNKRQYFLEREEISLFMKWFELFEYFLQQILVMEEEVVFKWIAKISKTPEPWNASSRKRRQSEISSCLEEVLLKVDETRIQSVPPGELFSVIAKSIDEFSRRILRYFSDEVREVSPLIKKSSDARSAYHASISIAGWLRTRQRHHDLFELLVRWTGPNTSTLREDLTREFLSAKGSAGKMLSGKFMSGKVMSGMAQRQNSRAKLAFEKNHTRLVTQFYNRWKAFEQESTDRGAQQLRIAAPFM